MKPIVTLLFALTYLCLGFNAFAQQTKVLFINPGHNTSNATGSFWFDVNRFMQAAANDLNLSLTTLFANRDHLLMKQLAQQVTQYQPDVVIIVNEKGVGVSLIKQIAKQNIAIFTLLNGFTEQELDRLTKQQKQLLLGSLIPDNYHVGQALMADLYQLHQQKNRARKPYELLVLKGDYTSAASIDRERGLTAHLMANRQLHLLDSTVANWSSSEAYKKIKGILQHNKIDIIWAANDPMAYGASRALKEFGLLAQTTIGGINWDNTNADNPIDVSYGGHVILGAKALIMLHDYYSGSRPLCKMNEKQQVFTRNRGNNQQRFRANIQGKKLEQFDFSRFSLGHPEQAKFDLATFISHSYQLASTKNLTCEPQ